jgi:Domain of unknown function (DUF6265)
MSKTVAAGRTGAGRRTASGLKALCLCLCLCLAYVVPTHAMAQTPTGSAASAGQGAEPNRPVSIEAASWLVGHWHGTGLGGQVDEVWSPAVNGQMIGHFRLAKDGKPVFHEFMILEEHEGGLRLRVKHFNPDMVGWEDKDKSVDFGFVSVQPDRLTFRGLVLRREGPDRLEIALTMRTSNAERKVELFQFVKVRH